MVKEAEEHAEEDAQRRELIEIRNLADNSIYQAEKMITEHGDKVDEEVKSEIESNVTNLRSLLSEEATDSQTIRSATEVLGQSLQKIGEAIYSQTSTDDPIETEPLSEEEAKDSDDENTVDGEYREA